MDAINSLVAPCLCSTDVRSESSGYKKAEPLSAAEGTKFLLQRRLSPSIRGLPHSDVHKTLKLEAPTRIRRKPHHRLSTCGRDRVIPCGSERFNREAPCVMDEILTARAYKIANLIPLCSLLQQDGGRHPQATVGLCREIALFFVIGLALQPVHTSGCL